MGTYIDLTGEDPNYLVQDQRIVIFPIDGYSFVVPLLRPTYMDSIKVYRADVLPMIELNNGIDWVIRESDIDYAAMGKAKLLDADFSFILVKSITVIIVPEPQMEISLSYNTLEMSYIDYNKLDVDTVDLTPELITEISQTVAYLRDTRNPIENLLSQSSAVGQTLDEDLTGVAAENLIEGEVHTISSQAGVIYIKPVCGSFYRESVVVRRVSDNAILTVGVDYRIINCNTNKTRRTSNTSGVYDIIVMVSALEGNVSISYQAFGGEVTKGDVDSIFSLLLNVIGYINQASFLTPSTVGGTTTFIKLLQKVTNLEETVRILSTGGTPNYAYSTDGKAFLHKFASPDSVNKHWYNIAKLYMVEGSTTVFTKNQSRYKIQCAEAGLMFDVMISVDIDNEATPIVVDVLSSNDVNTYIPYTSYDDIDRRITPEFRIIWNEEIDVRSGVYLQIGFNLKHIGVETMALEDLSGKESCWIALTPDVVAADPADNLVTLPDGTSIWSTVNPVSMSAVATPTPRRGYLAWAGNINLNGPSVSPVSLNHIATPVDITLENVKEVTFHIWDRISGNWVIAKSSVSAYESSIKCNNLFYPDDFCSVNFTMTEESNAFFMSLSSILGNKSKEVEAYELREITLHF